MVGFVAFYLILRVVNGGVVSVALVVEIFGVYFDDPATDASSFGVPTYVVADLEFV